MAYEHFGAAGCVCVLGDAGIPHWAFCPWSEKRTNDPACLRGSRESMSGNKMGWIPVTSQPWLGPSLQTCSASLISRALHWLWDQSWGRQVALHPVNRAEEPLAKVLNSQGLAWWQWECDIGTGPWTAGVEWGHVPRQCGKGHPKQGDQCEKVPEAGPLSILGLGRRCIGRPGFAGSP